MAEIGDLGERLVFQVAALDSATVSFDFLFAECWLVKFAVIQYPIDYRHTQSSFGLNWGGEPTFRPAVDMFRVWLLSLGRD